MYVYVHFIFKYFSMHLLRKRTFPCTTALPLSRVKKINFDSIISSTIQSIFNTPSRMSFCSHSCFISELNQVFASCLVVLSLSPLWICLSSCFCFPWHWTFRGNQVNCLVVCSILWTSLMFSSCLDSSYMCESGLVSYQEVQNVGALYYQHVVTMTVTSSLQHEDMLLSLQSLSHLQGDTCRSS